MTNQTPLNPDALWKKIDTFCENMAETGQMDRMEAIDLLHEAQNHLAVAQPVVNSAEELDALPVGTVVIINGTMLQADDRDVYGTMWSRVRDIDAYPSESLALPARVLYRPAVNDA